MYHVLLCVRPHRMMCWAPRFRMGRVHLFCPGPLPGTSSCTGIIMSKRLSVEDRHAIDLLLERPDAQGNKSLVEMVFARPVKGSFEKRLDVVESILNVLSAMPAAEPPKNLVSK